jgi:citrate lyase subunit beta/citryl-CoA lyase
VRKVRPLLFVPAHEERFIAKAQKLLGGEVVLDLEDGCPKERRHEARANIEKYARPQDWIRVSEEYEFDVRLAGSLGVRGIVVPHATPEDVLWDLGQLERMSTIESAVGLEHAGEIARFSDALILGMGDLAVSLDSDAFELFASQRVVLAAKAAGIPVYAPPSLSLDWQELCQSARSAYLLGFDGQAALHPNAVGAIRMHGCPTVEEFSAARALVEQGGYRMAREGQKLIGPPHYRRAKRILGGA